MNGCRSRDAQNNNQRTMQIIDYETRIMYEQCQFVFRKSIPNYHMTAYCFDLIISVLRNLQVPKMPSCIPNEKYALFVTWKKGYERRLRGCIGTFNQLVLHKGLHEYALISAFKDSRFDPITLREVDQLHCAVSLLMNFEKLENYWDWTIGVHGIRIEFQENHHSRDAVYLPDVAAEQGWSHAETLDNLLRKGGFKGPINDDVRRKVIVYRFRSEKIVMSHKQYLEYKTSGTVTFRETSS